LCTTVLRLISIFFRISIAFQWPLEVSVVLSQIDKNRTAFTAEDKIREGIYARMTPAEKWQEVLRLRETALILKRANLKLTHPNWGDDEIETELRKIFSLCNHLIEYVIIRKLEFYREGRTDKHL